MGGDVWFELKMPKNEMYFPNEYYINSDKYNARELMRRIQESAEELGYTTVGGERREHLEIYTSEGKLFAIIKLRRSIRFPFNNYLKAFNDSPLGREEFENELSKILDNIP